MLQEISLLSEDLLADGADMFPLSKVKFIVAIERLLVLQLISIQRTKLNVIHHDQLSFFANVKLSHRNKEPNSRKKPYTKYCLPSTPID